MGNKTFKDWAHKGINGNSKCRKVKNGEKFASRCSLFKKKLGSLDLIAFYDRLEHIIEDSGPQLLKCPKLIFSPIHSAQYYL